MTTSSNPPPLSYADRAKKAPGVKGASTSTYKAQPPLSLKVGDAPSISNRSSVGELRLNGKSSSLPSPDEFPPPSSASVLASLPTASRSSQSYSVATDDKSAHSQPDHILTSESMHPDPAPLTVPSSSSKKPPVNVWNQRMEARAQTRPLQSISQNTDANPTPSSTRNNTNGSSSLSAPHSSTNASVSPTTRSQDVCPSPTGRGSTPGTASKKEYSPPVQAPHAPPAASLTAPPPLVGDPESWPEVGRAATLLLKASQPMSSRESVEEKEREREKGEETGDQDDKGDDAPVAIKKSERTRWVPIPREEWQASIEPHRPHRSQPHSRNHSHIPTRGTPGSGPGSANASRGQSKAGSGRTSKASSVHSSPHRQTRGRQLPSSDLPGPVALVASSSLSADVPPRLSRTNSPRVFAETTFAAPVPFMSIHQSVYKHDASASPVHPTNGATFYMHPPPGMPSSIQPSPSQSRTPYSPASASPFHSPFAVQPNGFVSTSHGVPPLMQGYPGSPPHAMYGPYGYPYGQPYPYWNGVPQESNRSHHHGPFPPYAPPYAPPPAPPPVPPTSQKRLSDPDAQDEPAAGDRVPTIPRPPPPPESDVVAGVGVTRGRTSRDVVFGSFGLPEGATSPSPVEGISGQDERTEKERPVLQFTVGVAPGEAGPSHIRSRTRSIQRLHDAAGLSDGGEDNGATVVDLTDPETKWEFGTTMYDEGDVSVNEVPILPTPAVDVADSELVLPHSGDAVENGIRPPQPQRSPQQQPSPPPSPPNGLQLRMQTSQPITPQPPSGSSIDEWEVKDYGYGFGRGGVAIHPPATMNMSHEDRKLHRDSAFVVRPRRGSYSGFAPGVYDGPSTPGRGGMMNDRGGFTGRRGRGFGRGGLGGRGFGRGGIRPQPQQAPPFTITPPSQPFRPLPPPTPPLHGDIGVFIPPHQPQPYVPPQGFEQYYPSFTPTVPNAPSAGTVPGSAVTSVPLPRPISQLTFPLDPTRFHLLGQLEYYLSPQNMAQDLFLRKRMDSRGWIPISLLASFNRVKQLASDERLVKDVMGLSLVVEVREDHARMGSGEWERFVLPGAPLSTVEQLDVADVEGEEEEEEEVEFVMGQEADHPWVAS